MNFSSSKAVNTLLSATVFLILFFRGNPTSGQIDPENRRLIQLGYKQSLVNDGPRAAYAFYYWNKPDFFDTNQTLRLVVAPTYFESEWGLEKVFGPDTDIGIGLSGGGFAYDYIEIRKGDYVRRESFNGHGAGIDISIYHLFNPGFKVPLYGIFRGGVDYVVFDDTNDTADNFETPPDQGFFFVRTGLRFGGKEPVLFPKLAMELAAWYEGRFRQNSGRYGFNNDRRLESSSHKLLGRCQFNYTFSKTRQYIMIDISGGSVLDADRFSAFRLGSVLPFSSEFPFMLPGYHLDEISAENMGLINVLYSIPFDERKNWSFEAAFGSAIVDYAPGLGQTGNWHSGVEAGIKYDPYYRPWTISFRSSYGFDAIRSDGRGGYDVGILFEYDFNFDGKK